MANQFPFEVESAQKGAAKVMAAGQSILDVMRELDKEKRQSVMLTAQLERQSMLDLMARQERTETRKIQMAQFQQTKALQKELTEARITSAEKIAGMRADPLETTGGKWLKTPQRERFDAIVEAQSKGIPPSEEDEKFLEYGRRMGKMQPYWGLSFMTRTGRVTASYEPPEPFGAQEGAYVEKVPGLISSPSAIYREQWAKRRIKERGLTPEPLPPSAPRGGFGRTANAEVVRPPTPRKQKTLPGFTVK